jgi:phosphoglycolate phosphatase
MIENQSDETSETLSPSTIEEIRAAFETVKKFIWDFDGPLVNLYARNPAPYVAESIGEHIVRKFRRLSSTNDPLEILRRIIRQQENPLELVGDVDRQLTMGEIQAAETAELRYDADDLVKLLADLGIEQSIASNNSPIAINKFLARPEMSELREIFGDHVYGRDDTRQFKPNPYSVERAMLSLNATPDECIFYGDSSTDMDAAVAIGMRGMGFGMEESKSRPLWQSGATLVVSDHARVIAALS